MYIHIYFLSGKNIENKYYQSRSEFHFGVLHSTKFQFHFAF